jgi:hypothetical protein
MPFHNQAEIEAAPYPVKALVFVNYNHSAPFVFEEVEKDCVKAAEILMNQGYLTKAH